jgi:CheY-like chemotaxis protein
MIVTRVRSLVEDVVEFTRTQWKSEAFRSGRHIDVKNDVGEDLLVACNPSELREVFTNIMLNALAAMPDGGVIRFAAEATRERVRIQVIDTGVGMSETTRSNIFDPFFTTRNEEGNGLGMSIVYGILMRHGGAVSVESEAGQGSTIIIELPRAVGELPESLPTPPVEEDDRPTDCNQTLLVVDDEDAVRDLLAEILASAGYTVFQASSGADALKVAGEESIDCLLTDLGMSPMSGWELAREIKSQHDIPVILVTGWAGEIDAAQARENKVDRVISKPFDPEELVRCISELCSGEH